MWHVFLLGVVLGWGAAIPIGPINLEIIRRNLQYGTLVGLSLGFGACVADLTYLILLSFGALQIFTQSLTLKVVGLIGGLILGWFGLTIIRSTPKQAKHTSKHASKSLFKNFSDGYLLTLINPYNIVFWFSVSVTIAANTTAHFANLYAGMGVLFGTISWIFVLNIFIHIIRHRISNKMIRVINLLGGIILVMFAVLSIGSIFFR